MDPRTTRLVLGHLQHCTTLVDIVQDFVVVWHYIFLPITRDVYDTSVVVHASSAHEATQRFLFHGPYLHCPLRINLLRQYILGSHADIETNWFRLNKTRIGLPVDAEEDVVAEFIGTKLLQKHLADTQADFFPLPYVVLKEYFVDYYVRGSEMPFWRKHVDIQALSVWLWQRRYLQRVAY